MAANVLADSRLDYFHSLLKGLSINDLLKLQRVQNSLVKTVINTTWFLQRTPVHKRCICC